MSEYSGSTVNGNGCSYASLAHYNNGSQGMSPAVPRGTVSGSYIVPNWGAPGYGDFTVWKRG